MCFAPGSLYIFEVTSPSSQRPIAIGVHGGAGTILKEHLTNGLEQSYRDALSQARDHGWRILLAGGSAIDAVARAAVTLEECPLFNAGKGAVMTYDGTFELDAAIMEGRHWQAGAVAGVRTIRNPVLLAQEIMKDGRFVFLSGSGAEAFADTTDLERVSSDWFRTDERVSQWKHAVSRESIVTDHDGTPATEDKYGTVGVVALDAFGDLAACTSTGGLTNKRYGRVGDSPIIGCGTYADNTTCAVSCTGYGEEFIRSVAAYGVAARMAYLGDSLRKAARYIVHERLSRIGGRGGLVSVDRDGTIAMPFNTSGMYRAWRSSNSGEGVEIWRD